MGAQRQFVVTDKYRKKKTIKWGRATIWLCNPEDDPRNDLSVAERVWFDGNVTTINVFNPLFKYP